MINLFTSKEVKNLDELSVKYGVSLSELMENAGKASFEVIIDKIIPSLLNFNNRITVLCGPGNNGGDGFVIAKKLIEKGANAAVITLGEQGALFKDSNQIIHQPAYQAGPVVETTGAGDAFNGGLAVAVAEGMPIDKVLRFACATASISSGLPSRRATRRSAGMPSAV